MPLLFTLFVAVPILEIWLFIVVGGEIGIVATLAIVVVTAFVGASLVSRQGKSTWASARLEMAAGGIPGKQLAHGAMILVAGALLLTPGFLTDVVGFSLLVPPVREYVRKWLGRRYGSRVIEL